MNIGCFINARLGSKRLPKKHLRDIGGKTAIERLLDRVEPIKNSNVRIIITTGLEGENKPFEAIAYQRKIDVYFGNQHNIPQRHLDCARKYGLDGIISLDADDVLISKEALQKTAISLTGEHSPCLLRTEGLPLGMNVLWAYTTEYLKKSLAEAKGNNFETGWGWIFKTPPLLEKFSIPDAEKIRATLDYPEDLKFFRAVYEECKSLDNMSDSELCKWILANKINRINKRWHL